MSCYSCSSEFSFFKKEIGCNVCGFSFCSRCCKKHEVPSELGKGIKQLICNKCYDKLTSKDIKTSKASPPLAHKKKMSSLKKQSFSVDSGSEMPVFSDKDREIAERLQKLKRGSLTGELPSEEDIATRLAKLKGIEPSKYKAPPIEVYRRPDMRTCVQQATDLMHQMALEAELDSRLVKPEDEIAARLARLRDEDPEKLKNTAEPLSEIDLSKFEREQKPEQMDIDEVNVQWHREQASVTEAASKDVESLIDDPEYKQLMLNIKREKGKANENSDDDDEEEANKLVEKFLATDVDVEGLDSLNDDTEESVSKSEKDTTEEFPWCVICTEDAKIRCFDCDSDIYCLRCFKECHDSLEITDHKTSPYLHVKNVL